MLAITITFIKSWIHRIPATIFLAFFLISLSACSSQKEVAEDTTEYTEREHRAFKQSFFEGQKDKQAEKYESAANHFIKCIALIPEEAAPYYELARIYQQQNKPEKALSNLEKAIALEPDNIWYQSMYAKTNAITGNYEKAVETYKRIIEKEPRQYDYHFELAGTYIMLEDYDSAIEVFNGLEESLGLNEEMTLQKQMLYMEMGKTEEAIEEVKKLVEVNPDEIRYWGILAELYDKNGERDKAMETYSKLVEMDSDNGMLRLSLSEFYRNAGNYAQAFEELKHAFRSPDLEIDKKINILLNFYAETEEDQELLAQAYALCEILVDTHPESAKAHSIYGDYLYRDDRLQEARNQFEIAAQYDKSRYIIWNQILILDSQLEDFDKMVATSEEALQLFPTMPSFYLFNGVGHLQNEEYDEAIESLLAGVDLVVENFDQLGQFYASLGDAYHAIGDHEASDEAYDKSLSVQEDNAYVLNNYSYYLSLRGEKLDQALEMAEKANELQPNEATFQDTYAWVLYQAGRYEEAREWLEKALNNGGITEGTILEHYGDVLYQLNRKDEALDYWIQAREAGDASEAINQKIADHRLHD